MDLFGHHLAFARIQRIGTVRRRRFADRCPQVRFDKHCHIVRPNFLIDLGSLFRIEVIDKGGIQIHHQTFTRRHAGRLFKLLGANGKLLVDLERIDQVNALGQHFSCHPPEQREDSDMSGINTSHGGEYQNHYHKCGQRNPEEPEHWVGVSVDHPASSLIENRHSIFSPRRIVMRTNRPAK